MYSEKKHLTSRYIKRVFITTNILLIVLFLLLLFVYWNTQIINNQNYVDLAIKNIVKKFELKAPRGLILDRHRRVLAENKINFTLFLIRENIENVEKSYQFASRFSGRSVDRIKKIVEKFKDYPMYYQVPIGTNISLKNVVYLESRAEKFPQFKIQVEPVRTYPNRNVASHLLGYISEISREELLLDDFKDYRMGDIIGRTGIEKQYEKHLRGTKGIQTVWKDNLEKVQRTIKTVEPEIGATVVLTIDLELQKYIEHLLRNANGNVGVVDLETGGLLALVNKPDFNLELFTVSVEAQSWERLVQDPSKPLQNKFIQGLYFPGSVFKIVMAMAGLEEGVITPRSTVFCNGSTNIYDRNFDCWNPFGHGEMNLFEALAKSCNVYFYQLGKKIHIDVISKYASILGLGRITEVDLPNQNMGVVPTTQWKMKTFKQQWFPGETISVAIGGGSINVTPVQMLSLISTVALRGKAPRLHLLKSIVRNGKVLKKAQPSFTQVPLSARNFDFIIEGLYRCVNEGGTGSAAFIRGLHICGKTGTSQIISKENPNYKVLSKQKRFRPHSWFVSFAPRNNPRIAMVVFIEHGGDAGRIAAPISAKIYRRIFHK